MTPPPLLLTLAVAVFGVACTIPKTDDENTDLPTDSDSDVETDTEPTDDTDGPTDDTDVDPTDDTDVDPTDVTDVDPTDVDPTDVDPTDISDTGFSPIDPALACGSTTEVLLADGTSGLVKCEDGAIDREASPNVPLPTDLKLCGGDEDSFSCKSDLDCTAGPNGVCTHEEFFSPWDTGAGPTTSCGCTYACQDDADCAAGEACLPGGVDPNGPAVATCVPADCTTSADCLSGYCGLSSYSNGCGYEFRFECRTEDDLCHGDAECPSGQCAVESFGPNADIWTCPWENCAIGRPIRGEEGELLADLTDRADWCDAPSLADDDTLTADPLVVGQWWADVAAHEHASVASFSRFSLQLMGLGAPPELLRLSLEAASDEIRHATAAYAIASSLLGRSVGPAALPVDRAVPAWDAATILREVIVEGCIGETLAAAEATASLERVIDPAIRAALSAVAVEETRHAALAWKTVRWLLAHDPSLRAAAVAALHQAIGDAGGVVPGLDGAEALGVLSSAARTHVRREALLTVVAPLATALFQAPADITGWTVAAVAQA